MKIGFDHEKYTRMQSERILDRIEEFGGKLYLELGGKLFDDFHASRVLPGFQPDSKVQMLLKLKEREEILIVLNADDIEKSKVRGDLGITYDSDVIRLIDVFREFGLYVGSVAVTQYTGQSAADQFQRRLEGMGLKVYKLYLIPDYPSNVPGIVSNISTLISGRGINIQNMLNKSRGEMAVTVLELAQHPDDTLLAALGKLNNVVRVRLVGK